MSNFKSTIGTNKINNELYLSHFEPFCVNILSQQLAHTNSLYMDASITILAVDANSVCVDYKSNRNETVALRSSCISVINHTKQLLKGTF